MGNTIMGNITTKTDFLDKNPIYSSYTSIRLLNISQLTPEATEFKFEVIGTKPLKFLPGQYMDFIVDFDEILEIFTAEDHRILSQRKFLGWKNPYPIYGFSFISNPDIPTIEFISQGFKVYPHPVQRYLHTKAKIGDIFFISKEGQGKMYWTEQMGNSITCIVGGIGITGVISILRSMKNLNNVKLIISTKFLSLIPHLDEIKGLVKDIFVTITGEIPDGSKRLNLSTLEGLNLDINGHVFICGPLAMTEKMKKACEELGFDPDRIHSEKWKGEE